jgi:tRNA 2-thiouridine synthesizing protein E
MSQDQSSKPSVPKVYTVNGEEILLDEDGFLVNPESWSEELAEILAREDGLNELTETHWRILKFLRTHYRENGKAPLNSQLKKATGLTMAEIQACFPGGIRKSTRRLAGLPNLKDCA